MISKVYASSNFVAEEGGVIETVSGNTTFSALSSMIPMVLIFIVFYFFLIRPQEKRRKEKESLISTIKKGEEVLTNSGIYGIVTKINDDIVELEISEKVIIRILKSAIIEITSRVSKNPSKTKSS